MGAERRLPWDVGEDHHDLSSQAPQRTYLDQTPLSLVRTGARATEAGSVPQTPEAWTDLVDRIRRAGGQARMVDAQAKEQEQRVQEILERVRADIQGAEIRVKAAEQRAVEAQAQAAAQVRAAEERARVTEERAKAAEERALVAEGWLQRVHQTVMAEFAPVHTSEG